MTGAPTSPDEFGVVDQRLLEAIRGQDQVLRALLCTLARYGVAFRSREPARAVWWLDELSVHPLYKAGQFLFDLLEWEDFMLDGPAPPVLTGEVVAAALNTLAGTLRALASKLQSQQTPDIASGFAADQSLEIDSLPPLAPGFYLFQDVVLGGLAVTLARLPREG